MKKFLPVLAAFLLAFLSVAGCAFAETAEEVTAAPAVEVTAAPEPTATPERPVFKEYAGNVYVKEEDGGEFRPLPMDIDQGGAKLQKFSYNKDITVYQDPTIRVECHRVEGGADWQCVYYYADITVRDPSQIRTAFATRSKVFNPNHRQPAIGIASRFNAVLATNGDFFAGFSGDEIGRAHV